LIVKVLIHRFEEIDEGIDIIGVFSSMKSLRNFVKKCYPDYEKDKYGYTKISDNSLQDYEYLEIEEFKVK